MTTCPFNNLSSPCTAIFSEGKGQLYTCFYHSISSKNTHQPNFHSRPLSPSRLPLRAHFHQKKDVWVRGSLFSLYVLFPQWRSEGNLTLSVFINHAHICTGIRWNLNETVLKAKFTWYWWKIRTILNAGIMIECNKYPCKLFPCSWS